MMTNSTSSGPSQVSLCTPGPALSLAFSIVMLAVLNAPDRKFQNFFKEIPLFSLLKELGNSQEN